MQMGFYRTQIIVWQAIAKAWFQFVVPHGISSVRPLPNLRQAACLSTEIRRTIGKILCRRSVAMADRSAAMTSRLDQTK
jgi:hypothetical protein